MSTWENFEIECTEYLNRKFGVYAEFIHQGGADSTVADIFVRTKKGKSFYIEAKHSPAQCGQFVLLPDIERKVFCYSQQNISPVNEFSKKIINYMDTSFDEFRNAGTTGKSLDMKDGSLIFSSWIMQNYRKKGVLFFITNDYVILPIEHFSEYFDVSAKYRIKRSGSNSVGKSNIKSVMDYVQSHSYAVTELQVKNDKLFVKSKDNLHNQRFILNQYEYMFSSRGEQYEIRRLSNTYNANVIFSILKKEAVSGLSDDNFIDFLKK